MAQIFLSNNCFKKTEKNLQVYLDETNFPSENFFKTFEIAIEFIFIIIYDYFEKQFKRIFTLNKFPESNFPNSILITYHF